MEEVREEDVQMIDIQSPMKNKVDLLTRLASEADVKVECVQGAISFRRMLKHDTFKVKLTGR